MLSIIKKSLFTPFQTSVSRRGFILFIVIVVLIMIGIMALAFSFQKAGEVEQLSKSIDQNRLMILAQSANNEVFGCIKYFANRSAGYPWAGLNPCTAFRDALKNSAGVNQPPISLLTNNFSPPETKSLADALPSYKIKVLSKATIVVTGVYGAPRRRCLTGYVEVVSRAEDRFKNSLEVLERREVKFVDIYDFFDKYALFVNNFCYDYNNPKKRLIVEGVPMNGDSGVFSRVYVGNRYYPDCKEKEEKKNTPREDQMPLFFDLYFPPPGGGETNFCKELLGGDGFLKDFTLNTGGYTDAGKVQLALQARQKMKVLGTQQIFKPSAEVKFSTKFQESFRNYVQENDHVKKQYLLIIKAAQQAVQGNQAQASVAVSNSAAHSILTDYDKRDKAKVNDFSNCEIFKGIVTTFINNWQYKYGYTDATHIWDLNPRKLKDFAGTKEISIFSGIASYSNIINYNPERFGVGSMASLFGEKNDKPLLVEGMAYLRFYKIAFFDDFITTLNLYSEPISDFYVSPVPLSFVSPLDINNPALKFFCDPNLNIAPLSDNSGTKLNLTIDPPYMEKSLMSRPVDHIPFNRLINQNSLLIPLVDSSGQPKDTKYIPKDDKISNYSPSMMVYPTQNKYLDSDPMSTSSGFTKSGMFFPKTDLETFSYNFSTPKNFLDARAVGDTLYIDGRMYIQKGDLNLTNISKFEGKGMIYLSNGNCFLGSLRKTKTSADDTLRIFLLGGAFKVVSSDQNVEIHASLIALGADAKDSKSNLQGKLIPNNHNVTIFGNLIVDHLFTEGSNPGLGVINQLKIIHDPNLYSPTDPYRISIGGVRTLYSINSGKSTF